MINVHTNFGNCITLKGRSIDESNSRVFLNRHGWHVYINKRPVKIQFGVYNSYQTDFNKFEDIKDIDGVIDCLDTNINDEEINIPEIRQYLKIIDRSRDALHI